MNSEIMEKKNLKKYDIVSIINKDEEISFGIKCDKSKKLIYGFLIILFIHILFFIYLIIFDKRLEQNQYMMIQNNNNLLRIKNDLLKKTSMIQNLVNIIDNFVKILYFPLIHQYQLIILF